MQSFTVVYGTLGSFDALAFLARSRVGLAAVILARAVIAALELTLYTVSLELPASLLMLALALLLTALGLRFPDAALFSNEAIFNYLVDVLFFVIPRTACR